MPRRKPTPTIANEPPPIGPDSPERFINRELSWLDFNKRVVEEAENQRHPLLERLRFVSISASNLDEFISVRVAGLMGQAKAGVTALSPDGRTPAQQLAELQIRAQRLIAEQQHAWTELRARLHDAGIELCPATALPPSDHDWLQAWFMDRVFPVLTPLAVDPAHPFPFIPNMGLVKVLKLARDDGHRMDALVPLPSLVERFVRLPPSPTNTIRFVLLEDMLGLFLHHLFPGFRVLAEGMFRLIRDTGVEYEEEAEDLVRSYETALKRRRRGVAIHLAVDAAMPDDLRALVIDELEVDQQAIPGEEVVVTDGLLGLADLKQLIVDDRPDLLFPPYTPASPNASATSPETASPPSAPRTSSSTTPSRASTSSSSSSARPPPTPPSSPSSRPSTAPARTAPSSAPSSRPPKPASPSPP